MSNLRYKRYKSKPAKYDAVSNSILEQIAEFIAGHDIRLINYGPNPLLLLAMLLAKVAEIDRSLSQTQIRKSIEGLERRNIISLEEINNEVHVILEEKGKQKVAQYSLAKIMEYKRRQKKWNGKWYMVFFDIPESQRNKRDYLRKFLRNVGFYQFQKSVYIFPFECEQEIEYIRNIVESAKYTKYIIADKIEDEDKIRKFFNL